MDIATIIGLFGSLALIVGAIAVGGSPAGFVDVPSILVVFGGTIAVAFIMFPLGTVLGSMKVGMKAFFSKAPDPIDSIDIVIDLADRARKESLVALEKVNIENEFLKRGVLLVADGTEESLIRSVMEIEVDIMKKRHRTGQEVFKGMGNMAPAFGMIGTLIGLVRMLQALDDPSSIGPAMAVALLTTFYGAILANCIFLPLAKKLEERSNEEAMNMELMTEGVLSILNGEHPNIVREKLNSFLPPSKRQDR
ncbi:MotA/TolQ/ExbB proton channel family protein [Halodesulfovibrio sp.]|jgi:chemotaxis protein MotA|uniref:motility protein A n=1 Tax=Halodesulfovibrio sp. TaxID=1912772 RepID=UPI0025EECEF8|nr:MotA/TolQ/ExbB proton channel family protein [Halodesulfovibrio sp.]MCT4533948.1 MotA/TolQ/ExbB proton channel family protein [Halodesulfovibrio sp.]MCT4627912.1 MotA/TolQ/ExbB proton channel family protein [Halodesulfovibrio sp.]